MLHRLYRNCSKILRRYSSNPFSLMREKKKTEKSCILTILCMVLTFLFSLGLFITIFRLKIFFLGSEVVWWSHDLSRNLCLLYNSFTNFYYIGIYKLFLVSTELIQCVPLTTEPGISLIILTPMKILQRNLNRSTFVVWEMKRNVSVVRLIAATRSSG